MKTKIDVSRRSILKGIAGSLGAAAVSVPLFDVFGGDTALAQDGVAGPKRLILLFHGNGVSTEDWRIDASNGPIDLAGTDLPVQVRGLQHYRPPADTGDTTTYDFRDRLLMLEGLQLSQDVFEKGPPAEGGQHNWGSALLWTGSDVVGNGSVWPDSPSLDQLVAQASGTESLVASVKQHTSGHAVIRNRLSYMGPDQPVTPVDTPLALYNRMFAGLDPANADAVRRERLKRRSLIDYLRGDLQKIEAHVGAHEREKLRRHVEALQSIETRINRPAAECTLPGQPNPDADYPERSRAFLDMVVAAMRCGQTNVASVAMTGGGGDVDMHWVHDQPVNGYTNYHYIGHTRNEGNAGEVFRDCVAWFYDQLGYLMWALETTPEGGGTMLDNTLIVMCSEVSDGGHATDNMPFVLAGNVGGALKMGRYVDVRGSSDSSVYHQNLLAALAQHFDVPGEAVGKASFNDSSLASVLAA